jgi:hypothetical protein
MPSNISISFRVRQRANGGPTAGKTLIGEAQDFNLSEFLNAPNAEKFIRNAYLSEAKKIIRELDERKNGTVESDLTSYETVIARSLSFTQADVKEWIETRDWSRAKDVKNIEELQLALKKQLPAMASRSHPFTKEVAERLADKVIAVVADNEDPVADFLFTTLTTQRSAPQDDLLLL